MISLLEIHTLGGLRLAEGGEPVTGLSSRKAEALLVYLAVTARPQPREFLAELFWENRSQSQSQNALRVALSNLRKELSAYLDISRNVVALNPEAEIRLDTAVIEMHLAAAREDGANTAHELAAAADLYNGEFLQGFFLKDCLAFEEWAAVERERLHRAALDALQQLVTGDLQEGHYTHGIHYASHWVQLDPLSELAHRQSMRLLAFNGQRGEALKQYQNCMQVLAAELGMTPSGETTALYEAIKAGKLAPLEEAPDRPGRTQPPTEVPPCPYRGLFFFREVDAPFFFGRETFIEELAAKVGEQQLVTLIGSSGSGKSSVLFAGLIPRLKSQGRWAIASFRPGGDPFQAIAAALIPLLEAEMSETDRLVETRKLAQSLESGDLPLADVVERIVTKDPGADRLLLIGDQFEEFYTLVQRRGIQKRFLDCLLEILPAKNGDAGTPLSLALNLRADFFGQALAYRPIADIMQDSLVVLGPMNREELSRAVARPAQLQGVSFESGLVDRILDDLADEPGDLPLLQFALTTLWDHLDDSQLMTHQSYLDIGRVEGALARYADQTIASFSPEEQEDARQVFVQLVHPGEGTLDTRRIATRQELGEERWAVTRRLADVRLVVTGQDTNGKEIVELVHEALIQGWGQLRGWMAEDRIFRVWQEGLRASLRAWEAAGQDSGALLHGLPLAEAEQWLHEPGTSLSATEIEYIEASLESREARQAREEADRLARERLRRLITLGLGIGLVVTLLLAAFAVFQLQTASRERDAARIALSRQLSAQALNLVNDRYDLALLLGVEALNLQESPETSGALQAILARNPSWITTLHGHTDRVNSLAYSPDGLLLASGSNDGTVRLWNPITGRPAGPPLERHQNLVRAVAFSPDGSLLASGGFDGAIYLWDPQTGEVLSNPLVHEAGVWSLAFHPGGQLLAAGSGDGAITFWDLDTQAPLGEPLSAGRGAVQQLAFSPDGRVLASAGSSGSVILWNPASGEMLRELTAQEKLTSLAFSPDGAILATGGGGGTIYLWETSQVLGGTPNPSAARLSGHTGEINALAFSPDGEVLASASADQTIRQWSPSRGVQIAGPADGHRSNVLSLAYSPYGDGLASGDFVGKIILWNPHGEGFELTLDEEVMTLGFSEDGERLYSFSCDLFTGIFYCNDPFKVSIWDPKSSRLLDVVRLNLPPEEFVLGYQFLGRSNRLALTFDRNNDMKFLDIDTGDFQPLAIPLDIYTELSFAFNEDESLVAMGNCLAGNYLTGGPTCKEAGIVFFDLNTGKKIGEPIKGFRQQFSQLATDPVNIKMAFQPQSPYFWTGDQDGRLSQWDLTNLGDQGAAARLEIPPSPMVEDIRRLALDSRGSLLAATDGDTINIWDLKTLAPEAVDPVLTLRLGEEAAIGRMVFSPNNKLLATASDNGIITIWELEELLATPGTHNLEFETLRGENPLTFPGFFLEGHTSIITGLAFSLDGEILVSGGLDDKIIFWDLSDPRLRACRRANRNLTQEEWEQFFGDGTVRATCPELDIISP